VWTALSYADVLLSERGNAYFEVVIGPGRPLAQPTRTESRDFRKLSTAPAGCRAAYLRRNAGSGRLDREDGINSAANRRREAHKLQQGREVCIANCRYKYEQDRQKQTKRPGNDGAVTL